MRAPLPYDFMPSVPAFELSSDDLAHGEPIAVAHIYDGFGLPGHNLSPHLRWSGFPAETRSFAVSCLDVDAPTGSGFWHWMAFDLPVTVTELPRGAGSASGSNLPAGAVHVRNDTGAKGYLGPAPPKGDDPHRYVFAVHALGCATLGLDSDAMPGSVGYNIAQHAVGRALLTPVFGH